MKNARNFFDVSGGDAHHLTLLFSAAEFIYLLYECSKLFIKELNDTALLLFMVGTVGVLLVDQFFKKAIDNMDKIAQLNR